MNKKKWSERREGRGQTISCTVILLKNQLSHTKLPHKISPGGNKKVCGRKHVKWLKESLDLSKITESYWHQFEPIGSAASSKKLQKANDCLHKSSEACSAWCTAVHPQEDNNFKSEMFLSLHILMLKLVFPFSCQKNSFDILENTLLTILTWQDRHHFHLCTVMQIWSHVF